MGTVIGHEELTIDEASVLGKGSFGVVKKGQYQFGDVAIKEVMCTDLSAKEAQRFFQEVEIMAKLQHPNIISFYGYTQKNPYLIVMEYMSRGSLFEVLKNDDINKDVVQTLKWAKQISAGLKHLHEQKPSILHRALKSSNVLVSAEYTLKLTDFGSALANLRSNVSTVSASATSSIASVQWMAPELLNLRPKYSCASDIFALAIIFWELTSRNILPSSIVDNEVVIAATRAGKRLNIEGVEPPFFKNLIESCLAQDPASRPSVQQVLEILEANETLIPAKASQLEQYSKLAMENRVGGLDSQELDAARTMFPISKSNTVDSAAYQLPTKIDICRREIRLFVEKFKKQSVEQVFIKEGAIELLRSISLEIQKSFMRLEGYFDQEDDHVQEIKEIISRIEKSFIQGQQGVLNSFADSVTEKENIAAFFNPIVAVCEIIKLSLLKIEKPIEEPEIPGFHLSCEQKVWEAEGVKDLVENFLQKTLAPFLIKNIPPGHCFVSYAWPDQSYAEKERWIQPFLEILCKHCAWAGIHIVLDKINNDGRTGIFQYMEGGLERSDFVLIIGTESLLAKHRVGTSAVCHELVLATRAKHNGSAILLPILLSGTFTKSFPAYLMMYNTAFDWRGVAYLKNLQQLIRTLCQIAPHSKEYEYLWKNFLEKVPQLEKKFEEQEIQSSLAEQEKRNQVVSAEAAEDLRKPLAKTTEMPPHTEKSAAISDASTSIVKAKKTNHVITDFSIGCLRLENEKTTESNAALKLLGYLVYLPKVGISLEQLKKLVFFTAPDLLDSALEKLQQHHLITLMVLPDKKSCTILCHDLLPIMLHQQTWYSAQNSFVEVSKRIAEQVRDFQEKIQKETEKFARWLIYCEHLLACAASIDSLYAEDSLLTIVNRTVRYFLYVLKNLKAAEQWMSLEITLAKKQLNLIKIARALNQQGYLFYQNGQWTNAKDILFQSVGWYDKTQPLNADSKTPIQQGKAQALILLGKIYTKEGNPDQAIAHYQKALDCCERLTTSDNEINASKIFILTLLIELYEKQKKIYDTKTCYERKLTLYHALPDARSQDVLKVLDQLILISHQLDCEEQAQRYAQEATQITQKEIDGISNQNKL